MKKSVYFDTTIPSYLFDKRESIKFQIEITKRWWKKEAKKYQNFLSEITLNELKSGNYPNKEEILKFALKLEVLPIDKNIINIADIYIQYYIMPKEAAGDAMHLAYASFYKIDFLLTWNCKHLANANKKQNIRITNTKLDLTVPEIITPLELFTDK